MASVNKVIIIGNLGRDPDTRYTAEGGTAITTITVATSRRYKDSNGQPQEETEWHRVVFFGRQAEIAAEYLRKGRPVYIEGRLRTRKWQDQNGQDRYTTEIQADTLQMLDSRSDRMGADMSAPMAQPQNQFAQPSYNQAAAQPNQFAQPAAAKAPQAAVNPDTADFDDDMPF